MTGVISAKTCSHILKTLLALSVAAQGAGLRLTFPDINEEVITVAENSEIRIRFGVADLDGVTDPILINLDIRNESTMATGGQFLCVIIYNTSTMSFTDDEEMNCSVPPGGDTVLFTKTVSRQDNKAMLTWTLLHHGGEKSESLRLNVTYPPTITSLTFVNDSNKTTKTAQTGEVTALKCSWNNGNPPQVVRLLNNKGQMLTEDNSNTSLTYDLSPVTCNLTGVFTCQTAGAEVSRSVTLLVQCPPEFRAIEDVNKSFIPGQPVMLTFHVVSHTSNITQCRLRQLSSDTYHPHVYRLNSTFNCSMTGQTPDLKLTVVMLNVSDTEEGDWHLEVSNDSGNTTTWFSLYTEKQHSSAPADRKVYIMVAVGCGFLLLCVAIIVVFLLRRAKHTADIAPRHNVDSSSKKPLKPVLSEPDMIINEVYESAGDYPMSYRALGIENTALSGNIGGEYVYADTVQIVTWKEQNAGNTEAGNSGEEDNLYAKVQKGDRNKPSKQGDNMYAKVQKGDRNPPFTKEDKNKAKDHLTDDTECAYMSVDVPGAVVKEANGGDDHAS